MKMLKTGALAALILLTAASGFAQVDQGELQDLPPVTFINFEGPYSRIDTREQIRQIGVGLGQLISNDQERAGALGRYFVIHSVSGEDGTKIDADIFGLGVDAGVDHVRNLRTIIQGYLQTAYGYNARDALLLAEYITIYNAVYRGGWDYLTGRYKQPVITNITREKAGLSIRYDEWPGRTLLLIPLGIGGLSSVDTSVISDKRVIEEMRKDDDMGLEQRRDMVDLKEREADDAEQRARIEREAIREEERKVAEERRDIAQERQRTEEDENAGRITSQEAQDRNDELNRREEAVNQQERENEQRRDDAQRQDNFAEQKREEAQQDRRDIAEDQQAAIIEDATGGFLGVMIEKQDYMGRLIRFNTSGREIKRSPLDSIHVRTLTLLNGKIYCIAGENRGNGAVRLIEINQTNLEMARQGDDDLAPGSLLWVNNNDLYAITVNLNDNSCYLGRFNSNLALQAKSTVKIHKNASVIIQQDRLLSQDEKGGVLILNSADLKQITP
jgi:hypothetical protein